MADSTRDSQRLRRLWLWLGLGLLLLVAAALGAWWLRDDLLALGDGAGGDGSPRRPPPLVETVPAERATIAARIETTGRLIPPEAVTVTAQTAGRVAELHFSGR
jgi:multidrug efflux pump subunit AcrA (membrane-fusion protein)